MSPGTHTQLVPAPSSPHQGLGADGQLPWALLAQDQGTATSRAPTSRRGGPAAPKPPTLAKLLANPLVGSAKGSSALQGPPPQMQGCVPPGCLVPGL